MHDLPARMRHFVERSGLSQVEIARRVGVTPSAVTRWLQGGAPPLLANLHAFADACGVTLATFFAPLPKKRAA